MSYFKYNVSLTHGQKTKMMKSFQKRSPFTLRLRHNQLTGPDPLMLTKTQINRIQKSIKNKTGMDLRFTSAQMRKQDGGSLFSALMPFLTKTDMPLASKAIGPLASGALSGLSSFGVNKLLGGSGLFSVPQDKVDKLIKYKDYLTATQKKQIVNALQTGSGIPRFRLTKRQHGGFLGSLLASIGIPLVMNMLTGKGLHVDPHMPHNTRNIYVPHTRQRRSTPTGGGGEMVPYYPPPFYGNWESPIGAGLIKKKRPRKLKRGKGLLFGKNSPFKSIPIIGDIL